MYNEPLKGGKPKHAKKHATSKLLVKKNLYTCSFPTSYGQKKRSQETKRTSKNIQATVHHIGESHTIPSIP